MEVENKNVYFTERICLKSELCKINTAIEAIRLKEIMEDGRKGLPSLNYFCQGHMFLGPEIT